MDAKIVFGKEASVRVYDRKQDFISTFLKEGFLNFVPDVAILQL